MEDYGHLMEIDEGQMKLIIYRVFSDGRRQLFTEMILPSVLTGDGNRAFDEFSKMLGENVLLDSPVARKHFGM